MPQAWQFLTSPQKTRWQALRAASEKAARMGGNFRNCADLVRVAGIEPACPAWKAGIIAIIRHPHKLNLLVFSKYSEKNVERLAELK